MVPERQLIDLLPEAVVVVDADGTIRWANATAERMLGRHRTEWIGTNGLDLIHPDDQQFAVLSLGSVQEKEVGSPIEMRIATAQGWRLTEIVGVPLGDGVVALSMRDVTDRRRWEVATDESRLRALVQNSPALTLLVDGEGTIVAASAAITRVLGHDPEFVCGQPLDQLVHRDDREAIAVALHSARLSSDIDEHHEGRDPVRIEVSLVDGEGETVAYELAMVSLLDDPTVEGVVVAGHDISRLRAAQEALAEQANFDSLTGLANRRAFEADLEREWSLTNRDGVDSMLVVADLDGFKELNDREGHAAGDEALRDFAHCLRLAVRQTDTVARLGGDEFGIILVRCGGEMAAVGLEGILREIMQERVESCSRLSVSMGYASLRHSPSPHAAFEHADAAMFAAKRARRAATRQPLTWIGTRPSDALN